MALTAFTGRLGTDQGRVGNEEEAVFALGDDSPGRKYRIRVGDFVGVSQTVDVTGVDVIRVVGSVATPANTNGPGVSWNLELQVGGSVTASLRGVPGKTRAVTDLAANVSKMNGPQLIAVCLVATP